MRRRIVPVVLALGLAVTIPLATASAGDSTHVRLTSTGATASFSQVVDGLQVNTEVSANTQTDRGGTPEPSFYFHQSSWALDDSGEYNLFVWDLQGSTTEFDLAIGQGLAAATASAPAMTLTRCDETDCVDSVASVTASFTGFGTLQHSHQRSISSVSRQSMFVYNDVGAYRFATASVTLDGSLFGPSSGPSDAIIYDTRTGWIDMTKATPGHVARPAGVTVYDTTETPVGKRSGDSVYAEWSFEAGGIGRNLGLTAATQRISTKGTVENTRWVAYYEQVYAIDESGNTTDISFTQSYDTATAPTITVDKFLNTGTIAGAVIPAQSCTYVGDETLCIDTVIHASGTWTGSGPVTKTRDGSTGGVAGVILIQYRNSSQHRVATATATIDGETLSNPTDAWLDKASGAFHEVHFGG